MTVNHKVISSNLILRIWREAPNKREAPCERSSRWLRHDSLISLVAKYSLSTLCIDSECQGSDSPIKQRAQARMRVYGSAVYPPTKPLWPNWTRRDPSKVKIVDSTSTRGRSGKAASFCDCFFSYLLVTQLVEWWTVNPYVGCSIHPKESINSNALNL